MSRREVSWRQIGHADGLPEVDYFIDRSGMKRAFGHLTEQTPLTEIQAIMEGREDEYRAHEQQVALREAVAQAFLQLSPQDQFVLKSRIIEQLSTREVGERMGISHVHVIRLTRRASERLAECLQQNDLVRERIGMEPTTWDDSARRWVSYYQQMLYNADFEVPLPQVDIGGLRDDAWEQVKGGIDYLDTPILLAAIDHLALFGIAHLDNEAIADLPALLVYKQRRYGCDNILRFGYQGIVIRMSDKVERILQAQVRGDVDDEDPYTDLVGYAVIAHMVDDGTFTLPLAEDVKTGVES